MSLAKTKKKKRRKKLWAGELHKAPKIRYQDISKEQIRNFQKLLHFDNDLFSEHFENGTGTLIVGFDEVGRGCVAGPVCTGAYSAAIFYEKPEDLIREIELASQLVSSNIMATNMREDYYSETVINEDDIADEFANIEKLSSLIKLEDSKKITKNKREGLYEALINLNSPEDHIFHSTNFESAKTIDEIGIVNSIWNSMTKNLIDIVEQHRNFYSEYPETILLLVDGPKTISNFTERSNEILEERKIKDFVFTEVDLNSNQQKLDLESSTAGIKIKQMAIVKGDSKSSLIAAAANLAKFDRDTMMKESDHAETYAWTNNVGYGTKKHFELIQSHGLSPLHRKSFLTNLENN